MPSEQQLSGVLGELARMMVTDFHIQAILDRLVERIVDVLPVTAAGVTLISPGVSPPQPSIAMSERSANATFTSWRTWSETEAVLGRVCTLARAAIQLVANRVSHVPTSEMVCPPKNNRKLR